MTFTPLAKPKTTVDNPGIDLLMNYQRHQVNQHQRIDFVAADLSFANLSGVNLAGVNLKNALLIGADLQNANLTNAILDGANLKGANLSGAQIAMASLVGVNLQGANLTHSSLDAATLNDACLRGADLRGAYLVGVDFSDSHLNRSYYSRETCFQKGFNPEEAKMLTEVEITFRDVVNQLNGLGTAAKSYLGNLITSRYFELSLSAIPEISYFQIEKPSAMIICPANQTIRMNFTQLRESQGWVNQFIYQCSQVVLNFPSILDHQQVNYTLSAI